MATLVLAAAGAAVGGSFGGSLLGVSALALGQAVGATVGSIIDQRLLGAGAAPVETGRVERLRVMGSSEGAPLPRCFGRMRVAGQLIWSSRFLESTSTRRVGGKGGGGAQVREFSYSISLAVALCEGEVMRVGRIWADGQPLAQAGLNWRLYPGSEEQLPDPLIEAIEGEGRAPAYRGTAYVVIEDLDLAPFGNRIPQLSFEVFRRAQGEAAPRPAALGLRGVALVPGTGEYALATEPVGLEKARGEWVVANVHNDRGLPDLVVSLDQLSAELPRCEAVSLVVSWFADDLRIDRAALYPAVEQRERDGAAMPWSVSGLSRAAARTVSWVDGRPLFGGTPSDQAVIQAIREMTARGLAVMFYPFILLDITAGNTLDNPWAPGSVQPPVPWRGRMTLSRAPGIAGSPDQTAAAAEEVETFFGRAAPADFTLSGGRVIYSGPAEWSYRRFILHYAHLCALAGGVEAFCIGSEMRSLTQIRDSRTGYPAVRALRRLAEDVRAVLGPSVKLSYAADWSEYFGHHPRDGSGDAIFHLDELWAHPAIDFVGIDNYMPLSDWREHSDHLDAQEGSIYNLSYLRRNVAGGEGFDWYYPDQAARDRQERAPIVDGAYGEHWVYRYKDLKGWWSNVHVNRIGGVKAGQATPWQPRSKPIWFTELGCPAVDKGTNQPNVFFDPKSSESFLPYDSRGHRDDLIQQRYLQAMQSHWARPENNPASPHYQGRMVDLRRAFVWAWDARPWPDFPGRLDVWVDGLNHELGHWLNGRIASPSLAEVVAELCERAELRSLDVSQAHGTVTGYLVAGPETTRQSLQPLLLAYGLDGYAEGAQLVFASRTGRIAATLAEEGMVAERQEPRLSRTRSPEAELPRRVALAYVRADLDYQAGSADAVTPDQAETGVSESSLPLVLTPAEAKGVAERWLIEARVAREAVAFALPPSRIAVAPGDVIALDGGEDAALYRIDRIYEGRTRQVAAVRTDPALFDRPVYRHVPPQPRVIEAPTPVHATFLDLPLMTGEEVPHAPHIAVLRRPWLGPVAVYSASADFGYSLNTIVERPAVFGRLAEALPAGAVGMWSRGSLLVRLDWGSLISRHEADVLNGANAAAIRPAEGGEWEVIQFASAELVSPFTYRLSGLLRGQAGTDGIMRPHLPAGSDFVLLDAAVTQIKLPASARGLERHFRIGQAQHPYDHPSYRHEIQQFAGVGLRPYRPAHLRARLAADGAVMLTWIRRTRIDGDGWQGTDVPLGEERELYEVRVRAGTLIVRTTSVTGPSFRYSAAERDQDGATGLIAFEVAQVSAQFGPGPHASIVWHPPG